MTTHLMEILTDIIAKAPRLRRLRLKGFENERVRMNGSSCLLFLMEEMKKQGGRATFEIQGSASLSFALPFGKAFKRDCL